MSFYASIIRPPNRIEIPYEKFTSLEKSRGWLRSPRNPRIAIRADDLLIVQTSPDENPIAYAYVYAEDRKLATDVYVPSSTLPAHYLPRIEQHIARTAEFRWAWNTYWLELQQPPSYWLFIARMFIGNRRLSRICYDWLMACNLVAGDLAIARPAREAYIRYLNGETSFAEASLLSLQRTPLGKCVVMCSKIAYGGEDLVNSIHKISEYLDFQYGGNHQSASDYIRNYLSFRELLKNMSC